MSDTSPAAILYDPTGTNAVAVKPGSTAPTAADPALVVSMSPNSQVSSQLAGYSYSSYSPDPASYPTTNQTPVSIDAVGRLETHSTSTTDEGSFRDDFPGSALATALAGTLNFTNGSISVTGTGTTFTTSVVAGQWVKKTADAETLYAQVAAVNSDTDLTLSTPYAGTSASCVAGVATNWFQVTAIGGSITVASSLVALATGTTNGQASYIQRLGDYLPCTFTVNSLISQRIANQLGVLGFRDNWAAPTKRAEIQFTGTNNTQVNFVTAFGSAAADIQTTTVTIPNGGTTATARFYKIDLSGNSASLVIDGVVVATHLLHLPGPYDNLSVFAGIINTAAAASSTTLSVDSIYFYNSDRLQIDNDFQGEPLTVQGSSSPGQAPTTNPVLVSGSDGSLARTILTSAAGAVRVDPTGTTTQPVNLGQVGGTNIVTGGVAGTQGVGGLAATGTAVAGNPVLVAGSDGTNARTLAVDALGNLRVNTPSRQRVSITYQGTASAVTDTLLTLVKTTNGTAAGGSTTVAVAANKVLRINSITFSLRAAAAAAAFATFNLRINPSGVAAIGSQSEFRVDLGNTENVIGGARSITIPLPDGFELSGTQQLGVSAAAQATTNILSVTLSGYEY